MRITNDDYSPLQLLSELISRPGTTATDTVAFFSHEASSHDWLVKRWCEKLEVVLQSYKRYRTQVAETQFIRDHGVDVHLRFEEASEISSHVGFQIKSNQEAINDKKRPKEAPSMVATIKRQAFEAQNHGGVSEWWVVACFNAVTFRTLVSNITSELVSGKKGPMEIRIVSPREAMTFLNMPDDEINAICTLFLCEEDQVLKAARTEVLDLGAVAQQIVLYALGPALEGKRYFDQEDLMSVMQDVDLDNDLFVEDINRLESHGFLESDGSQAYEVHPAMLPALCALYFEARVRHGHNPEQASRFMYLMTRLGVHVD